MRIYATRRECEIMAYCLREMVGKCATASEMGEYGALIERIEGCASMQSVKDRSSYPRNRRKNDEQKRQAQGEKGV